MVKGGSQINSDPLNCHRSSMVNLEFLMHVRLCCAQIANSFSLFSNFNYPFIFTLFYFIFTLERQSLINYFGIMMGMFKLKIFRTYLSYSAYFDFFKINIFYSQYPTLRPYLKIINNKYWLSTLIFYKKLMLIYYHCQIFILPINYILTFIYHFKKSIECFKYITKHQVENLIFTNFS